MYHLKHTHTQYTHTLIHTYAEHMIPTHANTHAPAPTRIHTHARTHTHAQTQTHTYIHIHAHTQQLCTYTYPHMGQGKVIYYPYVPASVGPLVAAADSAGQGLWFWV